MKSKESKIEKANTNGQLLQKKEGNTSFIPPKNTTDTFTSSTNKPRKNANLPTDFQTSMENYYKQDFSNVEIHKNSQEASNLNALAFTQGNSIHFKNGEFDTSTHKGKELIAHELSHVVQQRKGDVSATHKEGDFFVNDDASLEEKADVDAKGALNNQQSSYESSTQSASSANESSISQKKETPIQLRRILPSGAPLAELSIDSNQVISAFESLWASRPDSYNSPSLFDTPENFADHPDLPDSVREVCGGDYFRGNNYWSSGWVDDGDTDILWAGDADVKAEMTLYIDNERSGTQGTGTFGSTSSTTRARSTETQTTVGGELTGTAGGHEGAAGGEAGLTMQNQTTESSSMTVQGGSSLSMQMPSTAVRADVVMFLKISFRPSIWDPVVGLERVSEYSPVVGSLLLGAPTE